MLMLKTPMILKTFIYFSIIPAWKKRIHFTRLAMLPHFLPSLFCLIVFTLAWPAERLRAVELPTSECLLIGRFAKGPINVPVSVTSSRMADVFGSTNLPAWPAEMQALSYFNHGGPNLIVVRLDPNIPLVVALRGSFELPNLSGLGLATLISDAGSVIVPELTSLTMADLQAILAVLRPLAVARHFVLYLDPPVTESSVPGIISWASLLPQDMDFAALSFPQILLPTSPIAGAPLTPIGGSGAIAAITARGDVERGLWKTPSAALAIPGLSLIVNSAQSDSLVAAHINPLRFFLGRGYVLFGDRSRHTTDPEKKYTSLNRLMRWTAHSLKRSLSYAAAVAPNQAPLWTQLRSNAEEFMIQLWRNGALVGGTANEAFFVRCDQTTTSAADLAAHRITLLYGMAVLRPAEFQIANITFSTLSPTLPLPEVPLIALRPDAGILQFSYPTVPGRVHVFEQSASLEPASWIAGEAVPGDGGWQHVSVPLAPNRGFFRVLTR
jgi:hypothetical protein